MDWGSRSGFAWVSELVIFGVGCGYSTQGCSGCSGDGDLEGDERFDL